MTTLISNSVKRGTDINALNEQHSFRHHSNGDTVDIPWVCAHELFEQQAAKNPDALAIVFEERQVTYRELNERANKVAHFLRKRGVGPETLIGVCLFRSIELVVALLAVWKAGGAYVPMDPEYPRERLSFMIEDAQTRVLLTEARLRSLFAPGDNEVICLDADWPVINKESDNNVGPVATTTNLAYIIYTSGSTGTPKGAMIVHRGLVNYIIWAIKAYGVGAGCSAPVHTSISFDLTVTSLFAPLLAGGMVELVPDGFGVESLLNALLREGDRSLVKITPAHLQLLNAQISSERFAGLTRTFVIGGENLLAENIAVWRKFAPTTRLINEYGPTETVVGCCVHETRSDDPWSGSVPIGRPIANTQLYILDQNLQPVPDGEIGELCIGGFGVARGYLNRPELTAEQFVEDRFSGVPGTRLYRSGDLARYRTDGTLECLGRFDNQIKINGYRIELGEIEAVLATHPNVKTCVVQAREEQPGIKRIVAHLIPGDGERPTINDLQLYMKDRLPEYALPRQFVFVDSVPLTPNGKVDRLALPIPPIEALESKGGAPQTPTQEAIAAIWYDLLKIEGIGLHDDFFDLGASSLAATTLVQRLRTTFKIEIGLSVLFDQPTIAGLAATVDVLTPSRTGPVSDKAQREEFTL